MSAGLISAISALKPPIQKSASRRKTMKHITRNRNFHLWHLYLTLLASILLASSAAAGVLALPDGPFSTTSNAMKPNFLYVLDNSYSMNYDHTNDALGTTLPPNGTTQSNQCKAAMKDKNGNAITTLSRSGTVLTITLDSGDYRANNQVYLAIPGNTAFSGTYKIITSNYAAGTSAIPGPCDGWTATEIPANIGIVYKYNEHGIICNNCGTETQYYSPACSVTTPQPANSGSTSTTNRGGGTDSSCYWRDLADTAAIPAGTCNHWATGTPATPATSGRILTVTVEDAGTSGTFPAAEIADAYIVGKSDDNVCRYEPPQYSHQINSLYYDPTVRYDPPPWPKNITAAAPGNLLPSMDKTYTTNWTKVRIDGTKLTAAGDPYTAANNTSCSMTTNNRLTCNNTYKAPDGTFNFLYWREMVYCDTPNRPTEFSTDRAWHESSHCKRNLLESNTVKSSPNYPYPYPATKDGALSNNPSKTKFYDSIILHQNGKTPLSTENPIADLYAFGEYYNYAAPHYFKVTPIEYCDSAKLTNCTLSSSATGAFTFPAYVRYCKTALQATDTSTSPAPASGVATCQRLWTSTYKYARYGLFERVDITPKVAPLNIVDKTFDKDAKRTDCALNFCSYDEEMTNFANWYAYYRTRIQLMKSASGTAFNVLDNKYRVGFMTISSPETTGQYLPINDFGTSADSPASASPTQKKDWLTDLYSIFPLGTTPLKEALSTAGRIFAGKHPVTQNDPDPMQYSCQSNYTLLTTDGFWNGTTGGKQIDGATAIGNLDDVEATSPRPKFEGNAAVGTLADVAKYYADTDIRDLAYNNCDGAIASEKVCSNDKGKQKMTTYTLGLGVDGELNYPGVNYENALSGDYYNLKNGLGSPVVNWPLPVADQPSTVDDLWHAAVNSDGKYLSAKSPSELQAALKVVTDGIDSKVYSGSPPAVSNSEPVAGDNYAFSTSFIPKEWSGNLIARELSLDVGSFYAADKPPVWCADTVSVLDVSIATPCTGKLPARVAADTRVIKINDGSGNLINFKYSDMSPTQKTYFEKAYLSTRLSQWSSLTASQLTLLDNNKDSLVEYLRGQHGFEISNADADHQIYRTRNFALGDITDSNPVNVGTPDFEYVDAGYAAYQSAMASRGKTVYVGANDGMLHAFNAANGEERWAFIPSALLPKLHKLADANYSTGHANFVNGDPVVGDAVINGAWRTILVSGLAQGGRAYFALDITDPDAPSLLWEFDNTDDSDLGFSYGQPVITKKSDGSWVVLLTSGYNNGSAGRLYVLDAKGNGSGKAVVLSEIATSAPNDSGLAQISSLAIDNQKNNTSHYAYGGDLLGNLWKFDIDAGSVNLFATLAAGSNQPITVAPVLASDRKLGTMVFVGTGKLLELTDVSTTDQQTLYGLWDDGSGTPLNPHGSSDFVQQVFTTDLNTKTRTVSNNPLTNDKKGWWIDLDLGERQTVTGQLLANELAIPTVVKSGSACAPLGYSWLNRLNYETGASFNGATIAGYYYSSPLTGLVPLVKLDTDGEPGLETTGRCETNCEPPPNPLIKLYGGSFGKNRLIWRELLQ